MELREIIIVFGLIAIVVIIWDGLRRMKRPAPKAKVKSEPYIDPEEAAKQAQIERELPNGGARVRVMTNEEKAALDSKLNLRERVPMLMERVNVKESDEPPEGQDDEPALQAELDFSAAMAEAEEAMRVDLDGSASDSTVVEAINTQPEDETLADIEDELEECVVGNQPVQSEFIEPSSTAEPSMMDEKTDADEFDEPDIEAPDDGMDELGPVEDLVIIHVMAPDGADLPGSQVLDLLVTAGLRHGPMDIFHYRNPKGQTEFSLANCVQPGTFNPDAMNQVATPGVTLFMQLPCAGDAMESFDHMYEMAVFLAKHLQAQVLDEDHSTVTPQRIEYYREKLRAFARSKLLTSH